MRDRHTEDTERTGARVRTTRRGFTLVELLVVLSTMTILAALLFPVFARVRAQVQRSTCASHLAQIAQAGLLYLQDYDDRLPSCYSRPAPPFIVDPRFTLEPYLKSWELFYCPARRVVRPECLDPAANFRRSSRCMGYGYNWGSGLGWQKTLDKGDGLVRWNQVAAVGVSLSEVANPSHCLFFGETNDYGYVTLLREAIPGTRSGEGSSAATNPLGMSYEPPRHEEGNHFAFVDEHVQWLRFPGGRWVDGGPWVVPDMSMYSRTGRWETGPLP